MRTSPIGLFDSGFGGLTVLKEVCRELPSEDIIYLGDTAHLPYGNKSPEKIQQLAVENGEFLMQLGIKLLIVACHTACSHALPLLQKTLPIPVIGVIEPGIEELLTATRSRQVAVLGTASTIDSRIYQTKLSEQQANLEILAIACPLFVPLIEEGFHETKAAELIARTYLKPVQEKACDAVLLACTHYPLIRPLLRQILGPSVSLIEPAKRCAAQTRQWLEKNDLLHPTPHIAHKTFYTTDAPTKFQSLGSAFLGQAIEKMVLKKTSIPGMIPTDRGALHEPKKANFTC
jgi:glutamate racemase